jgi:hypothetical protein
MSLKGRINKIEKKFPNRKVRLAIPTTLELYGAKPSKEEKAIAEKKVEEFEIAGSYKLLFYLPYGYEGKFDWFKEEKPRKKNQKRK